MSDTSLDDRDTLNSDDVRDTLTLYDLARLWGVSYGTVYEQARVDQLPVPVFRIGRRYLVSRKAYDDLMSARHEHGQQSA